MRIWLTLTSNFNATILKFSEKSDHPFSQVIRFGNMFPPSHRFVVMLVTRANNFVSYHKLDRDKFEYYVSLIQLVTGIAMKL